MHTLIYIHKLLFYYYVLGHQDFKNYFPLINLEYILSERNVEYRITLSSNNKKKQKLIVQ